MEVQWLRLPMQGTSVQFLVRKLGLIPGQGARAQVPQPRACTLAAANTWNSQTGKETALKNDDRK